MRATPIAARTLVAPEIVTRPDGVGVAAYRFGGEGPPLLLSHATGFHAHVWVPLLPLLHKRFTLFAFDLRGHGESATPRDEAGWAWTRLADDLLAVLDHFGLASVFAGGHSTGGALTILAELTRPGTIRRAVLFEPIFYPPEVTGPSPMIESVRKRRTVFESTAAIIESWSRRDPYRALDPEALRCYVEYGVRDRPDGTVELKCSGDNEVMTYRGDLETGIWPRLAEYRPPTLVMTGKRDEYRRSQYAERQAAAMPNGVAERLDDFGHFLPLQRPAAIAERMTRFLLDER